jgi:mRNA interferase RelE/StbE
MGKFEYKFEPKAFKQLAKLPFKIQTRIFSKLDFFCQKEPLYYADKLTDNEIGEFRFRIGNYRVVFDLEDKMIIILKIGHRSEIYR